MFSASQDMNEIYLIQARVRYCAFLAFSFLFLRITFLSNFVRERTDEEEKEEKARENTAGPTLGFDCARVYAC